MKKVPFYTCGLRFSCKRCSFCCRETSGFVYLSEKDLNSLASALKMDKNNFITAYCRWVTNWRGDKVLSLREKSNKDCILWNEGCICYSQRPIQCVTFPFWESIVSSKEAWEIAAGSCPGMNSGELHTEEAIEKKVCLHSSLQIINKIGGE